MELEIQQIKRLEDGVHQGTITAVEYRETPYKYTDLVIETTDGYRIKAGYPTIVTLESKLGRALSEFGGDLTTNKTINPDDVFVGKRCQFVTITEKKPKGDFPKVVPGSLRCVG